MAENKDTVMVTDISTILNETSAIIKNYHNKLDEVGEAATAYIVAYEAYIDTVLKDSTRLKNEMKKAVIRAVADNEL